MPEASISDKEAWEKVDGLWKMHKLRNDETMQLDKARPFIEQYIREVRNVDAVEDGLIMQIFNEIDEDGNQALERQEMFDFIKKQEFKEPNTPAPHQKIMTLEGSQLY